MNRPRFSTLGTVLGGKTPCCGARSGNKTESGVINMCPWTRDVPYETIAEKLHKQKGYKVGVGADKFGGVFDNTEIFHKLADLTKVQ